MRILFCGTPEVAVPSLKTLADADGIEVACVLTRPDAPRGRGRRLTPSPVKVAAQELGIPVIDGNPRDEGFVDELAALNVEAAAVVAYGRILPQNVLDALPKGWYNLHFSLLPQWRGAAPAQRAVWSGQPNTGATVFRITLGMDEGPILLQNHTDIGDRETSGELLSRMAVSGAPLLVEAMRSVADGTARPIEQAVDGVTVADKIRTDDAHVTFDAPVETIDRQIRACTPDPGAWCLFTADAATDAEPSTLHILAAAPAGDAPNVPTDLAPGELKAGKRNVWVGTGTTPLELLEVKAQGKKAMRAADWARGARLGSEVRCA
ncbi:methionyl-tRNA formyltransferase [Bifidobacterium tissieri]|uniref:Methionyl-tRNA formyltransferase n=1 Tax=Bifidobacterium tissieri TaxID=1630162 RepID=A0A5M9ZZE6_9BIFI|nr:methionyl-tRNA formyltransferase [Bifidobacterium tissieri]KAA8830290.1 methionyl-tRNA formyltransferase [Bifidobacterium tissieri]KAA8832991.1 methionyl-tRNA formyltransferase [Bifidobacterium tissieri]